VTGDTGGARIGPYVLRGGQARADVEQLPDPGLPDQVANDPAEQVTLGPHADLNRGQRGDQLIVSEAPLGDLS
jgi:hypothetical protein